MDEEGGDGVSVPSDTLRSGGWGISLLRAKMRLQSPPSEWQSLTLRTYTNPSWELFVVFS